jgi:signal transduction histidine kinase
VFLITFYRLLTGSEPDIARGLFALFVIIGALAVIVRSCIGQDAKTLRGRLRAAAWNGGLIVLAVALASAVRWSASAAAFVPLIAAAIVIFRPRWVRGVVAAGLVLLGLIGFNAVRVAAFGFSQEGFFGVARIGARDLSFYLLLPQAYLFLLSGGWIGWRALSRGSARARQLLGRLAEPGFVAQPWGLLLVPVAVIAMATISPNLWFGFGAAGLIWPVLVLGATVLFIRNAPGRAAATAAIGLIGLGLAGLYLAATYAGGGWHLPLNSAGYIEYGAADVTSQTMANLGMIQGVAFIAGGVWLVPRVAPGLLRYVGVAGYRDLAQRIQRLTETRAVAVDTAAADLRRLERDLHDGAQARLVALGMHLRAVEKLIPTNPDAALALVAEARDTSARALTELRELVRGVHPPVLADRGLADAIRALALDSPMRVQADIDLPGRLPAPIETACYFAVAEVLTNAAKHSGARAARVSAEHHDGVLRIVVTDFGLGGADASAGTGLAGVERRLATFDGLLAVSSPPGGPTMVVIEVPCALSPAVLSS